MTVLTDDAKVGLLLANTGTPASADVSDVKAFLAEFLMHRRIVPMKQLAWWAVLHLFILPRRSGVSAAKYETIWQAGGSPLLVLQEALRSEMQRDAAGGASTAAAVAVANGMSFGNPSILEGLRTLRDAGTERLVVIPLYPQSAYSTTAVVHDTLLVALAELGWSPEMHFVDNYHDNPLYIQALVHSVLAASFDVSRGDRLVLSYHSIPLADIHTGDSYADHCETTSILLAEALGLPKAQWAVGYQCRFDKGRNWLQPFTKDVLEQLAAVPSGTGRTFIICPGFAIDCLETLYDIPYDLEPHYQQALATSGFAETSPGFIRISCLNDAEAHVALLLSLL